MFSCLPLTLSPSLSVCLCFLSRRFFRFALFAFLSLIPNHHTPPSFLSVPRSSSFLWRLGSPAQPPTCQIVTRRSVVCFHIAVVAPPVGQRPVFPAVRRRHPLVIVSNDRRAPRRTPLWLASFGDLCRSLRVTDAGLTVARRADFLREARASVTKHGHPLWLCHRYGDPSTRDRVRCASVCITVHRIVSLPS